MAVVAECYLRGVSTRRVEGLVQTLGIERLSKSQVSVMASAAFEAALPLLSLLGPAVIYVSGADEARLAKLAHNVLLGVVTQSLAEVLVLAEK